MLIADPLWPRREHHFTTNHRADLTVIKMSYASYYTARISRAQPFSKPCSWEFARSLFLWFLSNWRICLLTTTCSTLAANVMESLLLNGICVNLIGIYCFWSHVQLRNEILLISSIHYVTKLNGQTQSVLSGDSWDSREGKSEFRDSHLKWSQPGYYHFDAFMQRGVSVKTIDISFNF